LTLSSLVACIRCLVSRWIQTDHYMYYSRLNMLLKLHKLPRLRCEACLACTIHLIWSTRPLVKAVNLASSSNLCLHKHSMAATLSITLHRCDEDSQLYTIYMVDLNTLNHTAWYHIQAAVPKASHTCSSNFHNKRAWANTHLTQLKCEASHSCQNATTSHTVNRFLFLHTAPSPDRLQTWKQCLQSNVRAHWLGGAIFSSCGTQVYTWLVMHTCKTRTSQWWGFCTSAWLHPARAPHW